MEVNWRNLVHFPGFDDDNECDDDDDDDDDDFRDKVAGIWVISKTFKLRFRAIPQLSANSADLES